MGRIETTVVDSKPDRNVDRANRQKLGWTGDEEEMYEPSHSSVGRIDDRDVYPKERFSGTEPLGPDRDADGRAAIVPSMDRIDEPTRAGQRASWDQ